MSNTKEQRAKNFADLTELVNAGIYSDLGWASAKLISPAYLNKVAKNSANISPKVQFKEENVLNTMMEHPGATVLVFCSAKNPGGGVLNGARAQEEDISMHSSWYFQVKDVHGFYLEKNANAINTDNLLYVEKGYVLRNEFGDINPVPVSFIGATAVNIQGMKNQGHKIDMSKVEKIMAHRIENVLKLAQLNKKNHLILGAWGCGVFGLEDKMIARLFKEKIEEGWFGGSITFSIMGKATLKVFSDEMQHLQLPPVVRTISSKKM